MQPIGPRAWEDKGKLGKGLERRETSVVALGTARAAENTGGPCDGHPWIGYVVNEPRIIRGKNP